ncbi:Phosphotyrosine protein phosphatase [Tenacibaculum sp. 190130A14a]|uniref:Phosphotyrosine protein phosphatase n=1 Tax=Tenacibaculum polynesiense TaxID=3137857 RepID=A0ABM9P7Z7_9FLAO
MRSSTAHEMYKNDQRFEIDSAGTDKETKKIISYKNLSWADTIIVMEKHHRNTIRKQFPDVYENKKIVCLYIPDEYDYMQPELITILKSKFENVNKRGLI